MKAEKTNMNTTTREWVKRIGISFVSGGALVGIFAAAGGSFTGIFCANAKAKPYGREQAKLCQTNPNYDCDMQKLRKVLGVEPKECLFDQCVAKDRREDKEKVERFERRKSEFVKSFPFVTPGSTLLAPWEGNPDDPVPVLDYKLPCSYPPFSVIDTNMGQEIGSKPKVLPAYCHPTPDPPCKPGNQKYNCPYAGPSPSPSCAFGDCDLSNPTTVHKSLTLDGLKDALDSVKQAGNPNPLESVGALIVRPVLNPDSDPKKRKIGVPEVWGSGFMVADHVFATSCHVLEPVFEKKIDPTNRERGPVPTQNEKGKFTVDKKHFQLSVNFGTNYYVPKGTDLGPQEFQLEYLDCSDQIGLDVAFHTVSDKSVNGNTVTPPNLIYLYYDKLEKLTAKPAVLITYIDLLHPLDEITEEMYHCFFNPGDCTRPQTSTKTSPNGKFAMIDGIVDAESCDNGKLNLLLDTADTSVGASGALVLDVYKTIDRPRTRPLALGLHKCCDAFFGTDADYGPVPKLDCARLERTPNNQDVTTNSIIKDPRLCYYLKAHTAWKSDDGGKESLVSCTEP
jgi:hypothetical protein